MKNKVPILYLLFLFVTIYVFEAIAKRLYPEWGNSPIERLSGVYIIILFLLGYILFSWKSNLSEFLRRACIAIPLALVFSVFIKITGHENSVSIIAGLFIFLLLLIKTPNWKQHLVAILISASVFIVSAKFFFKPLHESSEISFTKEGLVCAGFMMTLGFLLLYFYKLLEQDISPDLKAITIRSVKFGIAISISFFVYFAFNDAGDRLKLSSPVQLFLNTLLVVLFFMIGYKFDLFLLERKKSKKKTKISKLHDELNDFYLEERKKTKRKS